MLSICVEGRRVPDDGERQISDTLYFTNAINKFQRKYFDIIQILAVPGHALLWLSLVKWKRKKMESARF
jgi:hypothetical protein